MVESQPTLAGTRSLQGSIHCLLANPNGDYSLSCCQLESFGSGPQGWVRLQV
jgi:hypothetical protein